jgi:hypothetical protein
MRFPSPSYREYVEFVATVLATIGVLQYLGAFGSLGNISINYFVGLAFILPVFTYLLTVVCGNIPWIPQWDRMVREGK